MGFTGKASSSFRFAREEAGLPRNTGPYRVVTNLCVMGYDDESKRMKLLSVNPGVTKEMVVENTGFELLFADNITQNAPPTEEELRILARRWIRTGCTGKSWFKVSGLMFKVVVPGF